MTTNQVKDWMTSEVVTVASNASLPDVYWLMLENHIRRAPVVDENVLVGMVTMEDIRRGEPPIGVGLDLVKISDKLSKMSVRQVMTIKPKTIAPMASLIDAARMMLEYKISALPVLDGKNLVGIITESDIFRAFVELETQK